MRRTLSLSLLGTAAVALSGCFTYVPVDRSAVAPGEEVRVFVSRTGMAELPEALATERWLRGTLREWSGDGLQLGVPIARPRDGYVADDIRQDVTLPTPHVLEVERREFSRGRTAALVGGAAALAAAGIYAITVNDGSDTDEPDPGPEIVRIPFLTFALGFLR